MWRSRSPAGVCHSDLHIVKNDLGNTTYPIVPGHEIAGVVTAVGADVSRFKVGDRVGVGCMVDSCRQCQPCRDGEEQYCVPGMTQTYGSADPKGAAVGQKITQGGYSTAIVVDQNYVVTIPDSIPLDAAAPLLCAGITTYSPLKHWKVGPGSKVAVIGLAAWAIWPSNRRRPWGRRSPSCRPRIARRPTPSGWGRSIS